MIKIDGNILKCPKCGYDNVKAEKMKITINGMQGSFKCIDCSEEFNEALKGQQHDK